MPIHPDFPTDPHATLPPEIRWYPGAEMLGEMGYEMLLPPLVHKIRQEIYNWRNTGYLGASQTSKALLKWWFSEEHFIEGEIGEEKQFRYYFAQREAVETAIWLYEVKQARDPYALMQFDSSDRVSKNMFFEDWTRYVFKMATGSGKTKVMSLLIAWSYFHSLYEPDSGLSRNFLLIAPNIIVLERLKQDFEGLKIFREDPVLPRNGYDDRFWEDDFQVTLHYQDELKKLSEKGNIFLTNIHRVYLGKGDPSPDDEDLSDYLLGGKPVAKTTDKKVDLGVIVREVKDLVILNDEAHHIHDETLGWFKNIKEIVSNLRLKDSQLSMQLDFTATPKHNNGAIFVQTVCDYPLVEAIRQGVVKTPVLPDEASRAKLVENQSDKYTEIYADYINLGYLEWKKIYDELFPVRKKSILFVMTDDTKNCDEVGNYLEDRYPELANSVLVIHTNKSGEIPESASGKTQKEYLDELRRQSRTIDGMNSPYKAIVSVMMLREGWDVQNVVSIVGLRPYTAKSKILPEQTLGRGLRRMFRGQNVGEKVCVIGTDAFIDFVESIKTEGVELEYKPMGEDTKPKSPMLVEIDRSGSKNIDKLDIALPILKPRINRDFKNLHELNPASFGNRKFKVRQFSPEEQREIVFKDIDTENISHVTVLEQLFAANPQSAIGFFVRRLMRELRLVGGAEVLYEKVKEFMTQHLFETEIDLEDLNILRNMSESDITLTLLSSFREAINKLTVHDTGKTEIRTWIKLSESRPTLVEPRDFGLSDKCLQNRVIGDNEYELAFALDLSKYPDVLAFGKLLPSYGFKIDYQKADGNISTYLPDFAVKISPDEIWIVETKGRVDEDDAPKWNRLVQWCKDATAYAGGVEYKCLFVTEKEWRELKPFGTFEKLAETFKDSKPKTSGQAEAPQ